MKVLFDNQIFQWQKFGGISRYFIELKTGMANTEVDVELPLLYSENQYAFEKNAYRIYPFFKDLNFKLKPRIIQFFNRLNKKMVINRLKDSGFDLFHPTYFDPYFLEYLSEPYVFTIYDMIHEKFPDYFKSPDKTADNKKLLAEHADKIIAISHSTKNDILKYYPNIEDSKVHVTHLASNLKYSPEKTSSVNIPENYILFVGARKGYKNFQLLIRALSGFLKKDKDLFLICTGGGNFTEEEYTIINKLEINKQVMCISVNDDQLAKIYHSAKFFVFPSLYEGFGIPVLEAFNNKCPAILSNSSSLKEIGEDAAIYFDPVSEDSLKDKINSLLHNKELRNDLITKGLKQAKKFSWEKTTNKTLEVYKSV